MCLAEPARVVSVSKGKALLERLGKKLEALVALENVKAGDWVLVQQGMVVERLSEAEAKEALEALSEGQGN